MERERTQASHWQLTAAVAVAVLLGVTVAGPATPAPSAAAAAAAPPPVTTDWPIGHHGRWLTDARGRVLLLHGVNMVSKELPSPAERGFGEEDVAWLADNGFDVVRLGLTASALMPRPGEIDQHFLASFAATVHLLTAHGILVLVDLHQDGWSTATCLDGFPPWMTDTHGADNSGPHGLPWCYLQNPAVGAAFQGLWDNEPAPDGVGLADHVAAMFVALARAVGDDPGVLGYDLLNEPWPGTNARSCIIAPHGCPDLDATRLGPYYARLAAAIRAVDGTHLLFGEPNAAFALGVAETQVPVPGDDAQGGLAFHSYGPGASYRATGYANAQAWAARTGGALVLGEFGAVADPARINLLIGEAERALVPWIWWSYADNDGGGALIRDLTKPPTEDNLYTEKVAMLVRPRPVAVAGTPRSFAYDPGTHVLHVVFATTGPDGTSYPSGTTTVFDLPTRAYAEGWHATIYGGTPGPGDDPTRLAVVSDPGSSCVIVTVQPGAGPPVVRPSPASVCPAAPAGTTPTTGPPFLTATSEPATAVTATPDLTA